MAEMLTAPEVTDERRWQALQVAQKCIDLLMHRFGARRVILFGSLAGQGTWHRGSDIDLAVEGMPAEEFFLAYTACHDLIPSGLGLELDLVPLEDAYPEMRARILGEVDMPDDPILALKALIEDELAALNRGAQKMEELLANRAQPPTWVELYAMAGMLHEFYNGVERIFERIVVSLGEELPQGAYWHADLLNQVVVSQAGRRPAIIDDALRARLQEYLRFRHFFRHAYGYTLEWNPLRWLVEQMSPTLTMLREQLQLFFDGLAQDNMLADSS